MDIWGWGIICGLLLAVIVLVIKNYLLRKAAGEIEEKFAQIMSEDTNRLIDIPSREKHMRKLADSINSQLCTLRSERWRFQQGDMELKEAVTNISHDIRTPLTAIFGYLELLKKEDKSAAAARYLDVIASRAEVLKQLTEELFRYSIVTSKPEETALEEVVLNYVLEESISAYYAVLKGCHIVPEITMPGNKVIRRLDKSALSRIFGNIISNVVKYSDGDLSITLTADGEIIFANHASGLDEVQVGRLFDRFYTVENAKKSTGLGLSIAKVLTEQMNGSITADYREEMLRVHVIFTFSKFSG